MNFTSTASDRKYLRMVFRDKPVRRSISRMAKDFEATIESVEAFLYAASSVILLQRLVR